MKSKYEKLIECIINEDHDKATEIFHKIVIEKSREIYESFNFEDDHNSFGGDKVDGFMDEVSADEEGMNEEDDEFDGEEGDFGDTGNMPGGDEGDLGGEFGGSDDMDDMDDGMGDEGNMEDRVVDLEDALDELKAEFDRLMAGDDDHGSDDMDDMGGSGDDHGSDDMDDMGDDHGDFDGGEEEHSFESKEFDSGSGSGSGSGQLDEDFEFMREYVEKVTLPANKNEGGEVGAKGSKVSVNTKGIVAGKNDMGGTTANITKGGSNPAPDGTTPKSNAKKPTDLPNAGKFANVPGGDAGKTWNKKAKAPGNTEGKEAGNGKSVSVNKNSEIKGNNTGNKKK